ncbi:MAG TPA: M64 family metallopeptidase [Bacteroidia bacterium]|nr:M64 family metallopeptidase [Bacteroidia bacterium]
MKHSFYFFLTFIFLLSVHLLHGQENFEKYFTNATMRIDYSHTGDATTESEEIVHIYQYGIWAGSIVNLVDTLNYGAYYFKILDKKSGTLIYSKGFDSYFKEYQTSTPAIEGKVKTFYESAVLPSPKNKIVFLLEKRDKKNIFHEIFRADIDPAEGSISKNPAKDPSVRIYDAVISGDPHKKIDIAIIAEGYTEQENQKFKDDLKRSAEVFFRAEPCKSNKDKFNIRGVFKPSMESGVDEPGAGIFKNTAVSASFDALGSERYLLTEDNKALRDIASHAPYDALYIMVNSNRYGGGGIYNFYCVYTADNFNSTYLMIHEFGHSFFGLADEYYTSSTSYNNFYSPEVEPYEPNITALKDPANIKWKHLLSEGIEIPTPWEKTEYDSVDIAWQKVRGGLNEHITTLKKNKAPAEEIAAAKNEYDKRSAARIKEAQEFLQKSRYAGKVGAFEGAGYATRGLYRGSVNCIMFTQANYFCPVCQYAMTRMIEWYSK